MKPNQPIKNPGCGKCQPRKETARIHAAELEQCGGKPKVAKVEIPDYYPYFEDGVIGFREQLTPKSPRLAYVLVLVILLTFIGYHILTLNKLTQQEQTIDDLLELLEEAALPLPKGDGEIQSPGVLPPKGWIDTRIF